MGADKQRLALQRVYFNFRTYSSQIMADLSALLNASKNLTNHLNRPDLPSVRLSLDQIEAQSRRLVSRQPGTSTDADRAYVFYYPHMFV